MPIVSESDLPCLTDNDTFASSTRRVLFGLLLVLTVLASAVAFAHEAPVACRVSLSVSVPA